jgi:D-sedoheptulose 7-phosphate isomerase
MRTLIAHSLRGAVEVMQQIETPEVINFIERTSLCIADSFQKGGKVITAGNGGSMCDAMHFAEEITGVFRKRRRALPAIALSDASYLTCVGNDLGYNEVFARGVEAYGRPGDVFLGISTSGNSPNIVRAFEEARERGLHTIAMLGKGGGKLSGVAEFEFIVERFETTDRIQEAHMAVLHILIEAIEYHLFPALRKSEEAQVASSCVVA